MTPSAARGRARGELLVTEHPNGRMSWDGVLGGDLTDLCFRLLAIGFPRTSRLVISREGAEAERRVTIRDALDEAREKATAKAIEGC